MIETWLVCREHSDNLELHYKSPEDTMEVFGFIEYTSIIILKCMTRFLESMFVILSLVLENQIESLECTIWLQIHFSLMLEVEDF